MSGQNFKQKPIDRALSIEASHESIYKETTFINNGSYETLPKSSYKSYRATPRKKWHKYRRELSLILPYRSSDASKPIVVDYAASVDRLNCFQYIFFTWMSPVVRLIFYRKLNLNQLGSCSPHDSCHVTSSRFQHFWEKQCNRSGLHNASLSWTVFQFVRTRFLVACLFYVLCLITGYLSSTFLVKKLLEEIERALSLQHAAMQSFTELESSSSNWTSSLNSTKVTVPDTPPLALEAYKWTLVLFICELLRAVSYSVMFATSIRTGSRVVNALNGAIYRKMLTKLTNTSETNQSIQPNNLFANDLWKVYQMIYMGPLVIGSPIIILVTVLYSYYLIGSSAFYGIALFLVLFCVQFSVTKWQTRLRTKIMQQTDHRISLVGQLVKFIRAIKFNAWEGPFESEIKYCRTAESSRIRFYQYLQCMSTSMALLTPMLITISNILVHTWLGNDLAVSTAFSLVMLNYIAAHGIRSLPNYLRDIVNGRISLRRIERFLQLDNQTLYISFPTLESTNAIEIDQCSFFWTNSNANLDEANHLSTLDNSNQHLKTSFKLPNVTLNVPVRSHVCLYGPVGSGKTALLLSILGQTQCFQGQVRLMSDRVAYVSQTPWLQNVSIRENILFGSPFDRKRYYDTLLKCALTEDISLLAEGEDTVIGDNGVQLSGGQKQRIALARAVYADADLYLLDDCFSSLDARVVKAIFNNVINGVLAHKTVLFVTRHLYLLNPTDLVLFMSDGQVLRLESHSTLLNVDKDYSASVAQSKISQQNARENTLPEDLEDHQTYDINQNLATEKPQKSEKATINASYASLASLMAQIEARGHDSDSSSTDQELGPLNGDIVKRKTISSKIGKFFRKAKLNVKERSLLDDSNETRSITTQTYADYIKASGGTWLFATMVTFFIIQIVLMTFANFWLSHWLNQGSGSENSDSILQNPRIRFYQGVYLGLFFAVIVTSFAMACFFIRVIVQAANWFHHKILHKVTYSPLGFFDRIQVGKIVNLFSHNIDELDNSLPVALDGFLQRSLYTLGNFILIIATLYWFSIPFVVFLAIFYLIFRYYRSAVYFLKHADMRLRSPIYSHVTATLEGLSTIKAFGAQSWFESQFEKLCDYHITANFLSQCAVRWLSIRIDFVCILASLVICLLVLINLEKVGAAYAGLVITQSMQLSGLLQFVIRLALELETRLVSVERIEGYLRLLKTESSTLKNESDSHTLSEWPKEGRISYRQVSLRYRRNLSLALQDINFEVPAGQKFSIVGRTGSGKSSITVALFRLVEICSGSIFIDGVDIQSVPLRILRSKLSIIPQDPVLFQGTVRKNLDPWRRSRDDDLIEVLSQVNLMNKIQTFSGGLDEIISPGDKLSTGEKQLLCLARALLRKSRIVVLDEATSSVDDQTENQIWQVLQRYFERCTVVLIAHRLHTVLNSDQLILLKHGQVIEYGNPRELQANPSSHFAKLISKA